MVDINAHSEKECKDDYYDALDLRDMWKTYVTCRTCGRKYKIDWDSVDMGDDEWPIIMSIELISDD